MDVASSMFLVADFTAFLKIAGMYMLSKILLSPPSWIHKQTSSWFLADSHKPTNRIDLKSGDIGPDLGPSSSPYFNKNTKTT